MEGRLLLVDDELAVLDILSDFVAQGHDVETVTSGEGALKRVRDQRPDLVMLDVRMPGIDSRREQLAELELLLGVAVELGDLDTTTRDAVAATVGAARRTPPAA
jgi:CheY-like chemotaxis protein